MDCEPQLGHWSPMPPQSAGRIHADGAELMAGPFAAPAIPALPLAMPPLPPAPGAPARAPLPPVPACAPAPESSSEAFLLQAQAPSEARARIAKKEVRFMAPHPRGLSLASRRAAV